MAGLKASRYIEASPARARPVPRRRRPADRQPARAHRRTAPRRSRRPPRPARPPLRHRRPLRRADALLAGRAARALRARRGRGRRPRRLAAARRQHAPVRADADRALAARDARDGVRDRGAARVGVGRGDLRTGRGAARDVRIRARGRCSTGSGSSACRRPTPPARRSRTTARSPASGPGRRIRPTFRPDAVVALDAPGWRAALSELEAAADREIGDYATFVEVLAERRRGVQGARRDRDRSRSDECRHHAAQRQRGVRACSPRRSRARSPHADARRFEAHMLNEFARMSCDDGLVMQLHVGSLRDHNGPLAERFGHDIGADIPVATDWTRGLRPLLEACGSDPALRRRSLHARREHLQPRARAARRPLSRGPARLPVVVPRQPGGHRPLPRPGHRDGRGLQPRRLRRRRARADRAPGASRPLAAPHVRLARAEGRRRLPRTRTRRIASRGSSPTGSFAARTGWPRRRRTRRSRRRPGRRRR